MILNWKIMIFITKIYLNSLNDTEDLAKKIKKRLKNLNLILINN